MDLKLVLQVAEEVLALKPNGFDGNPDGYDSAILGITDNGQLVYSKEKMVQTILETETEMNEDDVWEFLEYNCFKAYVGDQTPIFVNTY